MKHQKFKTIKFPFELEIPFDGDVDRPLWYISSNQNGLGIFTETWASYVFGRLIGLKSEHFTTELAAQNRLAELKK